LILRLGLTKKHHTASKIDTGTEISKLTKIKPMIRNPSPGAACPPLATKFGSGGRATAPRKKAMRMPYKGPISKMAIALTIFMPTLVGFCSNNPTNSSELQM
jgi:hypothetical protein